MLMSMTGYGLGEAQGNGLRVTMEMQSINRKQLEFSISLPREFESLEGALKSKCTQAFSRGRIQCRIRVTDLEGHESVRPKINASLAKACHEAFDQLAKKLNLSQGSSLEWLARLPGVLTMESNLPNAEVAWDLLEQAADKAITDLLDMRRQEGSFLLQDLRSRILNLEEFVSQILPLTSELTQRHRQNLLKRLQEAGLETVDLDDDRLLKEIALFADRCDISEEITRLKSHFEHFEKLIHKGDPVGRSLDFLCQEMFREINTIGSKSNNHEIAHLVVSMKTELEKFREQVQNLE